jgi:hypothetical protein
VPLRFAGLPEAHGRFPSVVGVLLPRYGGLQRRATNLSGRRGPGS